MNAVPTAATFTQATKNISVKAGSDTVTALDGGAASGLFAVNFASVVFSGAQFRLYVSQDGFSQINAGDIQYGPTFNTADFTTDCTVACKQVNSTIPGIGAVSFYIGSVGAAKVVEGPIPVQLSNDYIFVKVFDGNTGAVALSAEQLVIVPGLALNPSSGPAGTSVTATGGGFPANTIIDLTYSYSYTFWNGTSKTYSGNWTTGLNTTAGFFSSTGTILDTKQQINPAPVAPIESVAITIAAALESTPHTVYASATFTEGTFFVNELLSYDAGGGAYDVTSAPFVLNNKYGSYNGSAGGAVTTFLDVQAVSLGTLVISGNQSAANAQVTFWVGGSLNSAKNGVNGGTQIGSATADANGFWNGTATIPALALGDHPLFVTDGGSVLWYQVDIFPSLVLNPSSGPVGTSVSATAYGFPANSAVYLYWFEHAFGDGTYFNLGNFTTGANGQFNVTVSFTVAHTYGGAHDVSASDTFAVNPTSIPGTDIADTTFTVTPQLAVSNSTFANNGGMVTVTGTGLIPGASDTGCAFNCLYQVDIDNSYSASSNQPYGTGALAANTTGDLSITFVAAGFRPGLHVFALMGPAPPCVAGSECASVVPTAPAAFVLFTVSTTGDPIGDQITALGTTISGLSASLTNIQNSLTAVQSSLSTITSDVSGLGTQLTSVQSSLTSVQSSLSTITSDVSGLGTQLSSIQSSLTTITSNLNTAAASAASAATNAQAAATAANNAVSGTSSAQTYVLVVAVLAAITLVLELAILVRKLS